MLLRCCVAQRGVTDMTDSKHRPPLPPFDRDSVLLKVRLAEDDWNTRYAEKVSLAYTVDTKWRNRVDFAQNRFESLAILDRSGRNNWIIDSLTSCGPSRTTGLR